MRVLLYTNNPVRKEAGMLNSELIAQHHVSKMCATWDVDLSSLEGGFDLIYVVSPVLFSGSAFELANRLIALERWSESAVVVNPVAALLRATKAHFTSCCAQLGIPHPRTLVTESPERALDFMLALFKEGRRVVVKPLARGEGAGVRLLQPMDRASALRYLLWYSSEFGGRVFYLQEYVENLGYDVRLFVIGGRVVARMKRMKRGSDFRYNLALGGVGEPASDNRYDELAVRSAEALGAGVAGVDVLPTENGAVVVEVNLHPGFKGIVDVTGTPIPRLLVDYFESLM